MEFDTTKWNKDAALKCKKFGVQAQQFTVICDRL